MGKRISLETRRRRGKRGGNADNEWVEVPLGRHDPRPYNSNNDLKAHTKSNPSTISNLHDHEDAYIAQRAKNQKLRKLLEGKTIWVLLFVIIMFIIGIVVYNTV
jgi:hypothetical protein